MRMRIRALVVLVLSIGITAFASGLGPVGVAFASHDGVGLIGGFEIDGNFTFDSLPSATSDWSNAPGGVAPGTDAFAPDEDDIFTQGSKEQDPDGWVFKANGSVPGKDDLTRIYFASKVTPPTAAFVWLAFERLGVQGQGDAHVNFELNQDSSTVTNDEGTVIPKRTANDLLVVYDYDGGNDPTSITIEVRKWLGTALAGSWGPPGVISLSQARGDVNGSSAVSRPPGGVFGGGSVDQKRFGEVGLDLLAIYPTAFTQCLSFTSFWAKSRASGESFNSDLKDKTLPTPVNFNTCPDVSIQKTTSTPTVTAGGTASYTVTVSGGGAGPANDVTLTDTLPSGLTWTVGGADAASCTPTGAGIAGGTTVTCTFGTMSASATKAITLTATTSAANCPSIQNSATVSASNEPVANQGNNSAGPVTITVNCPDVSVSKTTSTPTITAGGTASYSITVTAGGTGSSTGVTLTDTLPSGLTWTVGGADAASCSPTGSGIAGGTTVTCTFGTMAPGSTRTITLTATTSGQNCPAIQNTAAVAANVDTNNTNNSSGPVVINVLCAPDVSVSKTTSTPSVTAGGTASYSITVTAGGTGSSTGVTLTDTLPSGLTWTVGGADAAACSPTGSGIAGGTTVTCTFGTMAQGSTRTITLTATTNSGNCPAIQNTATVAATGDALASNNSSGPVTITVNCPLPPLIGIDLEKTGPTLAHVGDTITYTFTVRDLTTTPISSVVLTDPRCNAAPVRTGGDTNSNNVLEPGETWTYTCTHVVLASDPDPLPNTGTVNGISDGRPVSDSDSHLVDIIHPAISIVKTANPVSGTTGTPVTYTYVVTNTGDTTLFNVSVDDDKLGHIGDIAELEPGESATLTKASTLGTVGVTNVGTAAGTDVLGGRVQASDDATVTVVAGVVLVRTGVGPQGLAVGFAFIGLGLALVAITRRWELALALEEGDEGLVPPFETS